MTKISFPDDNESYENWLHTQCQVVEADLQYKHRRMRKDAVTFLRSTYFHWARRIETICGEIADAPQLLAVGDIHFENFGTWRDAEGRLTWGVNDFDEAAVMPYTLDLLRLATSVRLFEERSVSARRACSLILSGYRAGLAQPRPALLDDEETWMRPLVDCTDGDRKAFWRTIDNLRRCQPPRPARDALRAALPQGAEIRDYASLTRGGGSLGRPRFLVVADYRSGPIVREAKAFVTSAWDWSHGRRPHPENFMKLATGRYRAPDPHLFVHAQRAPDASFIVRRFAADSRKLDLAANGDVLRDERILKAMGADLAAIHRTTDGLAREIAKDLKARGEDWLHDNAKQAAAWIERTYRDYVRTPLARG